MDFSTSGSSSTVSMTGFAMRFCLSKTDAAKNRLDATAV
jgi:hypothetical protein